MARGFELISELHKDARGVKPTEGFMMMFHDMTQAQKQETWNNLCEELEDREARRQRYENIALEEFEARLNGMVEEYGISLATALRWDMESFDVDVQKALAEYGTAKQEIEFYLWKQEIPMSEYERFLVLVCEEYGLNEYAA